MYCWRGDFGTERGRVARTVSVLEVKAYRLDVWRRRRNVSLVFYLISLSHCSAVWSGGRDDGVAWVRVATAEKGKTHHCAGLCVWVVDGEGERKRSNCRETRNRKIKITWVS